MFIETVPNRTSPPAILLRESYRDEAGKAQKRTLANLSKLPASLIAGLKGLLKGGVAIPTAAATTDQDALKIERSLPHGHVAAGLGMLRKIHLDRLLLSTAKDAQSRRCCDLAVEVPSSASRDGELIHHLIIAIACLTLSRMRLKDTESEEISSLPGLT